MLDWELCTIGDPLADLGTIIASWTNPKEEDTPFIYSPSLSDGFSSRDKLIELYEILTNQKFTPHMGDVNNRIKDNLNKFGLNV